MGAANAASYWLRSWSCRGATASGKQKLAQASKGKDKQVKVKDKSDRDKASEGASLGQSKGKASKARKANDKARQAGRLARRPGKVKRKAKGKPEAQRRNGANDGGAPGPEATTRQAVRSRRCKRKAQSK